MKYSEAVDIWRNRNNCTVLNPYNDGIPIIDAGKGGRFWVDGEFTLEELEALLVIGKAQISAPDAPARNTTK